MFYYRDNCEDHGNQYTGNEHGAHIGSLKNIVLIMKYVNFAEIFYYTLVASSYHHCLLNQHLT